MSQAAAKQAVEPAPPQLSPVVTRPPTFPPLLVDIRSHGAVGDGATLNTAAFEDSIHECCEKGGGTVSVPPGAWLTGPIRLRSGIRLHVEAGAEIRFDSNPSLYPQVRTRSDGPEMETSPFLYAANCQNVAITGAGVINGQGAAWRSRGALRPCFVRFAECQCVMVQGVTLAEGPMWMLHLLCCDNVTVQGVIVESTGGNTDGVDIDSSRNVAVSGCRISSGDDCVVVKAGRFAVGRRVNRPSENIAIHHCDFVSGLGGVTFGSEIVGGIRNVSAHHCRIGTVWVGVSFKADKGWGGVVEDVDIHDLQLNGPLRGGVSMDMSYCATDDGLPEPPAAEVPGIAPIFRRIHISNVTGEVENEAIALTGLQRHTIQDVQLDHIRLRADSGIRMKDAVRVKLESVQLDGRMADPPFFRYCEDITMNRCLQNGACLFWPPASDSTEAAAQASPRNPN
jgi:polygalacturonase